MRSDKRVLVFEQHLHNLLHERVIERRRRDQQILDADGAGVRVDAAISARRDHGEAVELLAVIALQEREQALVPEQRHRDARASPPDPARTAWARRHSKKRVQLSVLECADRLGHAQRMDA
jgi:hypothetical protein